MAEVYVLLSLKDNRTYTGSTVDLESRFAEHKKGLVKSTKNRRPLKIIYTEYFEDVNEARKKQKYYKTSAGRKKLKKILKDKIIL